MRYNYLDEERVAMVQMLGMIKDVKAAMLKIANQALPIIK